VPDFHKRQKKIFESADVTRKKSSLSQTDAQKKYFKGGIHKSQKSAVLSQHEDLACFKNSNSLY
jgi:hypothetical protein